IEDLELRRVDELLPLIVGESPDVPAAFQVVVDTAQVFRRLAVRNQATAAADDQRHVLDPDRALVFTRAACGALPQDFLGIDFRETRLTLVSQQRVLGLKNDLLRVQLLPGAPRRAVHLAAAAFDASEGIEHGLAADILQRLEADFLFLEIEIRHGAELGRFQEDGDRREHQMEMLRRGNERQKQQDDHAVNPPVHAAGERVLFQPPAEEERDHQRGNEAADDDRLDRHVIAEADRADERAPDDQIENAGEDRQGKRRQRDAVPVEKRGFGEVENTQTAQEFTGGIAAK